MTAREAIKHLKLIVDNEAYTGNFQDACSMAIEALEKTIAKMPLYEKKEHKDEKCYIKREYYICPYCGKKLFIQNHQEIKSDTYSGLNRFPQGDITKYCSDCGQKMMWGI